MKGLFKGKTLKQKWVYGYYIENPETEKSYIVVLHEHPCGSSLLPYEVDPETVELYTPTVENKKD